MASPVEWQTFPRHSSSVQWGVAVLAGLVLGGGLAIPAIATVTTVGAPASVTAWGVPSPLGGPLLTAVALLSVTVLLAAVVSRYRRAREQTPYADAIAIDAAGVRWLPVAGVVATVVTFVVPAFGEQWAVNVAFVAVGIGALGFVAVRSLRGSGTFDPEQGTATVDGRVYDLDRSPTRAIRLGSLAILIVRRPSSEPMQQYAVLAMPTDAYRQVRQSTAGQPW